MVVVRLGIELPNESIVGAPYGLIGPFGVKNTAALFGCRVPSDTTGSARTKKPSVPVSIRFDRLMNGLDCKAIR